MSLSKILVVDDHEPFRRLICSMLEQQSEAQTVEQVSDGLEAVQIAEKFQPDLVLLDIGLPRLNGIKAAPRLRQLVPNAKILFVSQESSGDVVRAALDLGGVGYVHKSSVHDDLVPAIEAVLAGKQFVSSHLEVWESKKNETSVANFGTRSSSASTTEIL
jgi:two-component system, NarL family, nitrate/nitrite response regulator NarL